MGSLLSSSSRVVDMSSPRAKFVLDAINKDKVVIFSKSYCPYCVMAKEQFKKLNQVFTAIELDHMEGANEIQAILGEMTGATSVPRVFLDGKFIGGGTDVKNLYENGSLQKMLL